MSIVQLFNKKHAKNPPVVVPTNLCVIFNIVSHASLMAATLYTQVRRETEHETISIEMVDVRDTLPDGKDQYIWFGVNGPELYENYFKTVSSKLRNPSIDREWLAKLRAKSIVIDSVHSPQNLSLDTMIGRAFLALPGEAGVGLAKVLYQDLFTRFAVLSQSFEQDVVNIDDYQAYYTALDLSYSLYHGFYVEIQDLVRLSHSPKADEVEFRMNQKRIAKSLLRKNTECQINGHLAQMITTMGPDIYNLIRRIGLAKKMFVHMSYGSMGPVIYSENQDFAAIMDYGREFSKEAFILLPKPLSDQSLSIVDEVDSLVVQKDEGVETIDSKTV